MSKIKCRYCKADIIYNSISDFPTFPFCSERCQLMDFGLWLNEEHGIEEPLRNDIIDGEQGISHR
ncbi:MAG: DNA gyrase inhibitor YacG [Candidatus Scalindua sp. AMX11]|nr:MAG: DNA gyrase inhibitor YacG [Candidatus Scalindua sp.]NOG83019.1 DNA gyrase inhibitor YacG [Planctomycetota bacterium]RZV79579.1 MAG: DNA gyrase inhibitor YacG [Candidatus Scalindua sp. SCAELEC01]TDE65220.1 MAG: DNA gyrase inhibitor YacG [Candidatus Scalindua sp. AMX11]GJQ58543.1 MAG: hypothetical protein SCALA701_13440 [Candidatus Scalindua sp.]